MKYVYLLKAGADHYKVGISLNVERRVKSIQTSNGSKVYIVTSKLCHDAQNVERSIHKKLRDLGSGGGTEWFVLEPEDVIRICILLHQQPEIDVYANTDLNKQLIHQNLRHKTLEKKLNLILNTIQKGKYNFENPKPDTKLKTTIDDEDLFSMALEVCETEGKASTSFLQRKLRVGYGRAARLMDELELHGYVSEPDGSRARMFVKQETRADTHSV